MRKPRDFDQELKALTDKARLLKERKIRQLGELVIATGADALEPDALTGALLVIVETKDAAKKEAWRNRGRAFFRGRARGKTGDGGADRTGEQANAGATQTSTVRGNDGGAVGGRGFAKTTPTDSRNTQPQTQDRSAERGAQPNATGDPENQSHDAPH